MRHLLPHGDRGQNTEDAGKPLELDARVGIEVRKQAAQGRQEHGDRPVEPVDAGKQQCRPAVGNTQHSRERDVLPVVPQGLPAWASRQPAVPSARPATPGCRPRPVHQAAWRSQRRIRRRFSDHSVPVRRWP